ncbi:MAG: hypothetical protein A2W03_02815 [Candidatus Aminicenantes bacterium RBG_16_63_16]|nr:MAG: hypothetical protein A2W03_02815 [Candidatus Aminicenantes bacterium RBG_16_63_16]
MRSARKDFPWTYDQFQRYRVLEAVLDSLHPRKEITVLDVGGVSPDRDGRSLWLPLRRLVPEGGFVLDLRPARERGFIRGDGGWLPFKDKSFDVVASLDTLEHVPPGGRPEFLRELGRVARGSLVLSAPFRDPEIERVETLLFRQIRDRHGVEHEQLKEHGRHGLPAVDEVRGHLARGFPANVDFSYGSLTRWLFLQTIENIFLLRRNSPAILGLLDKWMTAADAGPEFEPPFSRHYWIASNEIAPGELERRVEAVKTRLLEPGVEFGEAEARELNREMSAFVEAGRVTAVVVSPGRGDRLADCLDHLLTQKVGFELEVLVWALKPAAAREEMLRARFPHVCCVVSGPGEKASQALLKIGSRAGGDYILLISDEILLPLDSAQKFYDALNTSPETQLVAPRTVFKRYLSPARQGKWNSPSKILAGRLPRRLPADGGVPFSWVFNECLFFRKEALFERELRSGGLNKRNIFFWEKAGRSGASDPPRWRPVPHTVFKRK